MSDAATPAEGRLPGRGRIYDSITQTIGDTPLVRIKRLAAEAGGQLGEADAAHLQQGQQKLGEEVEPCPVPGQVFGQDRFEVLGRVVRDGCHRSPKMNSVTYYNQ
jgi:hypothetical protein